MERRKQQDYDLWCCFQLYCWKMSLCGGLHRYLLLRYPRLCSQSPQLVAWLRSSSFLMLALDPPAACLIHPVCTAAQQTEKVFFPQLLLLLNKRGLECLVVHLVSQWWHLVFSWAGLCFSFDLSRKKNYLSLTRWDHHHHPLRHQMILLLPFWPYRRWSAHDWAASGWIHCTAVWWCPSEINVLLPHSYWSPKTY